MGLAWRWPPGGCHRQRPRSVTKQRNKETRDPVTSPPLPVPDRIARGQLSPKSWPQLFWRLQLLDLLGFLHRVMLLPRGTMQERCRPIRGKSVEFVRGMFGGSFRAEPPRDTTGPEASALPLRPRFDAPMADNRTISQLEAEGYPLIGCECCKGTVWVPFKMLRERLPLLSAMTLDQFGAKMRCDKCGKRPERYYPANQSDTPGFVRTF